MDKTETVSIIAICKDGGTKLVEYKGRKYHVDYRINSETSGRVYDDYPNRGNIISDHELEKEIQLALRDLLMKTETKEMEGELKSLHYKLYDQIVMIPNGVKFLVAVNEGIEELKSLRSELQKAKELNGEFLLLANEMVSKSNFPGCNYTIPTHWRTKLETLIKCAAR